MKLLVIGATRGIGRHVVAQALEQGHTVTVLVRDPMRLAIRHDRLHVVAGDATSDGPALAAAVRGQDVVISALGRGMSFKSENVIAESTPRILRAMEAEGVRRLIFTSAFGMGDTYRDTPLLPRVFIGTLLRDIYRDKAVGEAELQRSSLDWTLVYPTGLSDRVGTGKYRSGERLALSGLPSIARADVADFILRQIDDSTYVRKGVLVSS